MTINRLRYIINRQGKYRLHSPLVYDFYVKVLDNLKRRDSEELQARIADFRKQHSDLFNENDNIFIINDIHRNKKNKSEWEKIVADKENKLTIDCYRFGIVFKMNRIEKEHFIL